MATTTQNGGDDDGSLLWTIAKIIAFIVIGFLLIRLFLWVLGSILPLLIVVGVGYLLYRLFFASSKDGDAVEGGDPLLLEYEEQDPLEKRFRELEAEEARVNRKLADLDREP